MKVKNYIENEEKDSFICEDLDDLVDSDKEWIYTNLLIKNINIYTYIYNSILKIIYLYILL